MTLELKRIIEIRDHAKKYDLVWLHEYSQYLRVPKSAIVSQSEIAEMAEMLIESEQQLTDAENALRTITPPHPDTNPNNLGPDEDYHHDLEKEGG